MNQISAGFSMGLNSLGYNQSFSFSRFIDRLLDVASKFSIKEAIETNLVNEKAFRLLLADDDPDDQELLAEAISDVLPGIDINFVQDGKSLFEQLNGETELPDLIIIDLNMPGLNGFECLNGIKENDDWKKIPILIYSTSANPEQIDQTYKSGAAFYIQKPSSYPGIKKVADLIINQPVSNFFTQPGRGEYFVRF